MILPHKQGRWRLGIQNRPEAWAGPLASPGWKRSSLRPAQLQAATPNGVESLTSNQQVPSCRIVNIPVVPTVGPKNGAAAAWPGCLDGRMKDRFGNTSHA